ncbi:MAG: CHAT domain-containing tetratricopeptide repeat protein [Bacteroidota bacterium]
MFNILQFLPGWRFLFCTLIFCFLINDSLAQPALSKADSLALDQASALYQQARRDTLADSMRFRVLKAHESFDRLGKYTRAANCFRLATVRYQALFQDVDSMRAFAAKSVAYVKRRLPENAYYLGSTHNNMGAAFNGKGEILKARDWYLQSINLQLQAEQPTRRDSKLWVTTYNNIYHALRRTGDFEESIRYLNRALAIQTELDGPKAWQTLRIHQSISAILADLNEVRQALDIRLNLIDPYMDTLPRPNVRVASHEYGKAWLYARLGKADSALYFAEKGRQALNPARPWNQMYKAHLAKGIAFSLLVNQDSAKYEAQRMISDLLADTAMIESRDPLIGRGYYWQGQILSQAGLYEEALTCFDQALSWLKEELPGGNFSYSFPAVVLNSLQEKATALQGWARQGTSEDKAQRWQKVVETYREMCELIPLVRSDLLNDASRVFFSSKLKASLEQAMAASRTLSRWDEAYDPLADLFFFTETARFSLLQDNLQDLSARYNTGLPQDLLSEEKDLRQTISSLRTQLSHMTEEEKAQDNRFQQLNNQLFVLEEKLKSFRSRIELQYPAYYQLKYAYQIPQLGEMQQAIRGSGTQLLSYFWGEDSVYIVSIHGKSGMHTALPTQEVLPQLQAFLALMQDVESIKASGNSPEGKQTYYQLASGLYRQLLSQVIGAEADIQKWVVIPDGPLGYLPFGLLVKPQADEYQPAYYQEMAYALQEVGISYAYSGAWLNQPPQAPASPEKSYLGLAPTFLASQQLPALSYTQVEVSEIARLYDGEILTAEEATKSAFSLRARDFRYLHIASHAEVDQQNALESRLYFFPDSQQGAADLQAGALYAYDIYNLDLAAELVVLSACNTGVGTLQKGEGIMSLARAFAFAGCPNTLMTLWQADDETTSKITQLFFQHLKEGMEEGEALRQAKLATLASSDQVHPFFWGAFVMIGSNLQSSTDYSLWYITGFLLLALFVIGQIVQWTRR